MQEFPVHSARVHERQLALDPKRDILLAERTKKPDQLDRAFRSLEMHCVAENLRLTGIQVTREEVVRTYERSLAISAYRELIQGQLAALEAIGTFAHRHEPLEMKMILEVHRLSCPPEGGVLRRGPARTRFSNVEPSPPEDISDRVKNLMEWLAAESAKTMHVTERAALAFTRLLEIAPFENGNFRAAHLLLNFFALAEDYPPLHFRSAEAAGLKSDIERALILDTQGLVLRLTRALGRSLELCLDAVNEVAPEKPVEGSDSGIRVQPKISSHFWASRRPSGKA